MPVFEDAYPEVHAAKAADMDVLPMSDMLLSAPEIERLVTHVCKSLVEARNWLAEEHF